SPGRARRKPLKPLRAGMPGKPGELVVTTSCAHYHFARETAGASRARHSPRPLWAEHSCTPRALRVAGMWSRELTSLPKLARARIRLTCWRAMIPQDETCSHHVLGRQIATDQRHEENCRSNGEAD